MDRTDWLLVLVFVQVLLSLGILVMLLIFWLVLQGFLAAAASHASIPLPHLLQMVYAGFGGLGGMLW